MHKLQAIAGAILGTLLGLGLIGYVQNIITSDELIALLIMLAAGAIADHYLAKNGQ